MLLSPEDVERAVEPIAALPEEFFLLSDIICPNESETELITGLPVGSIDEAVRRANDIAAISVPASGTQSSFPKAADLPVELRE